jgi:hypothetical protein
VEIDPGFSIGSEHETRVARRALVDDAACHSQIGAKEEALAIYDALLRGDVDPADAGLAHQADAPSRPAEERALIQTVQTAEQLGESFTASDIAEHLDLRFPAANTQLALPFPNGRRPSKPRLQRGGREFLYRLATTLPKQPASALAIPPTSNAVGADPSRADQGFELSRASSFEIPPTGFEPVLPA